MALEAHDPRQSDGTFVARHASPIDSPVLGADGKLEYILHRVEDVTEFLRPRPPAGDGTAVPGPRGEPLQVGVFQSARKA